MRWSVQIGDAVLYRVEGYGNFGPSTETLKVNVYDDENAQLENALRPDAPLRTVRLDELVPTAKSGVWRWIGA